MSPFGSSETANVGTWQEAASPRWAVLDPAGDPPGSVFATVYIRDELLVERGKLNAPLNAIRNLATASGWTTQLFQVDEDIPLDDPVSDPLDPGADNVFPDGASETLRLRLEVSDKSAAAARTPDAWAVLRQARKSFPGIAGVSLNHVITTDGNNTNPFKANPFKANPFKANPFKANASAGMESYAMPGFGGRQPVTFIGARLDVNVPDDGPVVAVFDTGCGTHPWFDGGNVLIDGTQIGLQGAATDPEVHPQRGRPLEGWLDDTAGHGTFIAGIIRQLAPSARILPVRVADGEGTILENELIGALERLVLFILEMGEGSVDVLNLSFSYFHETPFDPGAQSQLATLLSSLRDVHHVVVVCSAGNDATDRPASPAALSDDANHLAVGALNPPGDSIALFSNIGDWVTVYAPGVSILSSVPDGFDGSLQPGNVDLLEGLNRSTLDGDDFRGGFGVWSGTSFAAPYVAGVIAQLLADGKAAEEAVSMVRFDPPEGRLAALRRAEHLAVGAIPPA